MKIDLRKADEEEKWTEKANGNKLQKEPYAYSRVTSRPASTSLTPIKGKAEEEQGIYSYR